MMPEVIRTKNGKTGYDENPAGVGGVLNLATWSFGISSRTRGPVEPALFSVMTVSTI